MYSKYPTLAFLVATKQSRESDGLFLLYTKDFGMLLASATAVRASKSKLRPHLVQGALLEVTLIKSKTVWKLIEVKATGDKLSHRSYQYKSFLKILSTLKALIHGEEKNESLFEAGQKFFELLFSVPEELLSVLECVMMVMLLSLLGYGDFKGFEFTLEDLQFERIKSIKKDESVLIKEINKALKATGY